MSKAPSEGQARTLIASFAVDTPWADIEADVQPFVELTPRERGDRFAAFLRAECNIEAPPAKPVEPVEKFGLLADLGMIEVPADYQPVTEFRGMSFPNPSRVLKPGDRLWVRAHKQTAPGTTTSEERLAFLKSIGSHLVGPQGIEVIYPKRRQLPDGYWYSSFDEKERLPLDAERHHRVPRVFRDFEYDFHRHLGYFEDPWYDFNAFLSFCDEPSGT